MKVLPIQNQARYFNGVVSSGGAIPTTKGDKKGKINYRHDNITQSEKIAQALDDYVRSNQRSLEIQVDKDTSKIIVKVVSKEDGRIIREIPSEDMVKLASKLQKMRGAVFNEKA